MMVMFVWFEALQLKILCLEVKEKVIKRNVIMMKKI